MMSKPCGFRFRRRFHMVEARGVEPLSENPRTRASPSAVCDLTFPLPDSRRQDSGFSSFIKSRRSQSLERLVPCLNDAGYLRRRKLRADVRGLRPRKLRYRSCQFILVPVVEAVQGCRSLLKSSRSPSKPNTPPYKMRRAQSSIGRRPMRSLMCRSMSRSASRLAMSSRLS